MESLFNNSDELLSSYVIPWGSKLFLAFVVFIIGRWAAKLLSNIVKRLLAKASFDDTLQQFIGNITYSALLVAVVIASLEQLGVDTTSILALFAAAGLAVGLALKDSLSNFAAGVMLVIFKPFKTGDFIEAAGVAGIVESVGIFNTLMRTGDNRDIIIPNGHVYGGSITNASRRETRRIDLVIGIGYEDNIGQAKSIVEKILTNDQRILQDPPPAIMVAELGESSVDLAIRPWVKKEDYWAVRCDLLEKIKVTFDENGISIPYPQTELHINQTNLTSTRAVE